VFLPIRRIVLACCRINLKESSMQVYFAVLINPAAVLFYTAAGLSYTSGRIDLTWFKKYKTLKVALKLVVSYKPASSINTYCKEYCINPLSVYGYTTAVYRNTFLFYTPDSIRLSRKMIVLSRKSILQSCSKIGMDSCGINIHLSCWQY
jgi:hypothetical protein